MEVERDGSVVLCESCEEGTGKHSAEKNEEIGRTEALGDAVDGVDGLEALSRRSNSLYDDSTSAKNDNDF